MYACMLCVYKINAKVRVSVGTYDRVPLKAFVCLCNCMHISTNMIVHSNECLGVIKRLCMQCLGGVNMHAGECYVCMYACM